MGIHVNSWLAKTADYEPIWSPITDEETSTRIGIGSRVLVRSPEIDDGITLKSQHRAGKTQRQALHPWYANDRYGRA